MRPRSPHCPALAHSATCSTAFPVLLAALLLHAPPAAAQDEQHAGPGRTILVLNGLGVGPASSGVGLNPLAQRLREAGYDVQVDRHSASFASGAVPNVIIGHSMGGGAGLRLAARLVSEGAPEPVVITVDATPPIPCPVQRCFNVHGRNFGPVPGAVNVSARSLGAGMSSHLRLPADPAVERYILSRAIGGPLSQASAPMTTIPE